MESADVSQDVERHNGNASMDRKGTCVQIIFESLGAIGHDL